MSASDDHHRLNLDLKVGDWVYNHGFAHASRRYPGVVFNITPHSPHGPRGSGGFDWVEFVIPGRGASRGARRNFTIIPRELVPKVPEMMDREVWNYIRARSEYNRIMTRINEANASIDVGSRMEPIPQAWFDAAHAAFKEMEGIVEGSHEAVSLEGQVAA